MVYRASNEVTTMLIINAVSIGHELKLTEILTGLMSGIVNPFLSSFDMPCGTCRTAINSAWVTPNTSESHHPLVSHLTQNILGGYHFHQS